MSETLPPIPPPAEGPSDPSDPAAGPAPRSPLEGLAESRGFRLAVLLGALGYAAYVSIWLFVLIMAIVLSVFLHELGHYLVAKRNGMKVTEFFIGFGPKIWSFQRGETEYGLKILPAGAYVRIIGMHSLEEVAPEDEERSYRSKSFGQRMPVVLAGPAVNIALGFLLLVVVFAGFGRPDTGQWKVNSIVPGSAAADAGLEPGDRVVAFQGQPVTDFKPFASIVRAHAGTTVDLTVERNGEDVVVPVTIGWTLTSDAANELPGLMAGDHVSSVGGTQIATYPDLVGAMQNAQGPVDIVFDRDDVAYAATIDGPVLLPPDGYNGFLGVSPTSVIVRAGVVEATGDAASAFGETIVGSVQGMGRLFSPSGIGRLVDQVATASSGSTQENPTVRPVDPSPSGSSSSSGTTVSSADADRPMSIFGIINVGTQLGEDAGWAAVLALLATLNIFLGLINLVPLLPFDGGHIAVATYEEVRTRISHRPYRVNMAKLMPVTYLVVLLMVGLLASTIYLDFADPVNLSP